MGDVTVWTGKRGEGKSTVLSQFMLDSLEQGFNVCAYSGELRADRFQYWTDLQAAGKPNVRNYNDYISDRTVYYIPQETQSKIHAWYDHKYWLYDNRIIAENEELTILNRFELAAKRYDCKIFMVDNLMTADYGKVTDKDFYRQQSRFVGQLVAFANKHNVHVHLVAHPRKTGDKEIGNDDVSGTGDITNRTANVILVKREVSAACDLTLEVKKNRWDGRDGKFGLRYCNVSHRVFEPVTGDVVRYGWNNTAGSLADEPSYPSLPF